MPRIYTTDWGRFEIVGAVQTKPAVIDEEGEVVTPAEVDSRFHVNAQGDVPESWGESLGPQPAFRKYGLGETKYCRFEDEAEFKELTGWVEPEGLGDE